MWFEIVDERKGPRCPYPSGGVAVFPDQRVDGADHIPWWDERPRATSTRTEGLGGQ